MSTRSVPLQGGLAQPQRPQLRILKREPQPVSVAAIRIASWVIGILLASTQAWIFRYQLSADSISYLDMSDAMMPGSDWHRLINGVWSPLYPFLLGVFRRAFDISPGNEIVAGHLLNIAVFIFAFACFEFFLRAVTRTLEAPSPITQNAISIEKRPRVGIPKWAYLPVAYSLFLWASIAGISLSRLRADMLMSGFLYLAAGMVVRMNRAPASWARYLALGAILGCGFLAKAPMLPIGVVILATTLFTVENWRPAVKMAAVALALMLLIGSLYFVPLSYQTGHMTLGESSSYNYVIHVDDASPQWYLQSSGSARGTFLRSPEKIFADPPAYAFQVPTPVTHPLRFDPSYWSAGVRPHFVLKRQLHALMYNLFQIKQRVKELWLVVAAGLVLAFFCGGRKHIIAALVRTSPIWLIGLAGCAMYAVVSVEPRYVAAFLALFWIGILFGFQIPRDIGPKIVLLSVIAIVASVLYPVARETYISDSQAARSNADLEAAQALGSMGVQAGDPLARISPLVSDFGAERILRAEIVAEVDYAYASAFWDSPPTTQRALLQTFAARGVKAVIATSPALTAENHSEWTRLGSTQYWVWRPGTR